jgi:hypothetical protein
VGEDATWSRISPGPAGATPEQRKDREMAVSDERPYEYSWDREDEVEFTRRLALVANRQPGWTEREDLMLAELVGMGWLDITDDGRIAAVHPGSVLALAVVEVFEAAERGDL